MASEDDRTLPVNRDHDDDVEKTLPRDSTVPNDASTDATLDIEIGPYRIMATRSRDGRWEQFAE